MKLPTGVVPQRRRSMVNYAFYVNINMCFSVYKRRCELNNCCFGGTRQNAERSGALTLTVTLQ